MRRYRCYPCDKYFTIKEFIIRKNNSTHTDFVCPICGKVIICCEAK